MTNKPDRVGGPAKGEGKGGSARRYTWPPFEPGNTLSMRHGARSDRMVQPLAGEYAPKVFEHNPHLEPERDSPGVWRYCTFLARIHLVYEWLDKQPDPVFVDEETGKVHGAYEKLAVWERQAAKAEDQLAISPLTRTKLGIDKARGMSMVREMQES